MTALVSILHREADPLVAFFPCDHYYANDDAFARTIRLAIGFAAEHPKSVILLGAHAHYPEVEYGWIEPGSALQSSAAAPLYEVNRFCESDSFAGGPGSHEPRLSLEHLRNHRPGQRVSRTTARANAGHPGVDQKGVGANDLDKAFAETRAIDFSQEILTPQPYRLLVMRDTNSGWADLGNPSRVIDTLARNHIHPPWLARICVGQTIGFCRLPARTKDQIRTIRPTRPSRLLKK